MVENPEDTLLELESIADDPESKNRTKLIANFDWEKIDKSSELKKAKIPYSIYEVDKNTPLGTTLKISRLREADIDFGRTLRTLILSIVSPVTGLDRGRFQVNLSKKKDPGFSVQLPNEDDKDKDLNLAEAVLSHCYASVVIDHFGDELYYKITHKDGRILFEKSFPYTSHMSKGFHADIRYFPYRGGMFQDTEVKGREAWSWVRANQGVGIIDHGFRVKPYGYEDDDWLFLDADSAHNRREWRSKLMQEHYPIFTPTEGSKEKANPMLYLPNSHQLVGAVFVESHQTDISDRPTDLTPAVNREGFIDNEAYKALVEAVRTGMELLAFFDHKENRRIEEETAKNKADSLKDDFRVAVNYIRNLPSLTEEDRARLTIEYSKLSEELENVETYNRESRERMDQMSLLGVLAGFMTHEANRLISDLDRVVRHLDHIAKKDEYIKKSLPHIKNTLNEFKGQVEYSTMFIESVQDKRIIPRPIPVAPQIEVVVERFAEFIKERKIHVDATDINSKLTGPAIPVAIYSGILMNLYTNALKAVSAVTSGDRRIAFKA